MWDCIIVCSLESISSHQLSSTRVGFHRHVLKGFKPPPTLVSSRFPRKKVAKPVQIRRFYVCYTQVVATKPKSGVERKRSIVTMLEISELSISNMGRKRAERRSADGPLKRTSCHYGYLFPDIWFTLSRYMCSGESCKCCYVSTRE